MTTEELIKIYSAYLPYKLEIMDNNLSEKELLTTVITRKDGSLVITEFKHNLDSIKPILYSMDMLTKEIEHKGEKFIPLDELTNGETVRFNFPDFATDWNKRDTYSFEKYVEDWVLGSKHCFEFLPYGFIQKLTEWHFNVFNLPETSYIKKENL